MDRIVEEGFARLSRTGGWRSRTCPRTGQLGGKQPRDKPWKGEGGGVFEMVEDHDGDTYRAVYTVRFAEVIYVLHAFQKKSTKGIKTAKKDIELVGARLKIAQADHAERFKKS